MLYCHHSRSSILTKMAADLASTTLSVPDDHHDEVKLLPDHQHPFDECEVDRRVQSVFFHHDIRKGIALKFFSYVGKTLLSYRMADLDTEEGRALFDAATERHNNQIEIAKLKFAVRRLCREDPLAALPKPPPKTGPIVSTPPPPPRRQRPTPTTHPRRDEAVDGASDSADAKEEAQSNEEAEKGGEVKDTHAEGSNAEDPNAEGSNAEGESHYDVSVDLPALKPLVSKLDKFPGYAARLCIVSRPRALTPLLLRDILCRFGDLIDVYGSDTVPKNDRGPRGFMNFAEFSTLEAAQTCKDLLHREVINGCSIAIRLGLPAREDGTSARGGGRAGQTGRSAGRTGGVVDESGLSRTSGAAKKRRKLQAKQGHEGRNPAPKGEVLRLEADGFVDDGRVDGLGFKPGDRPAGFKPVDLMSEVGYGFGGGAWDGGYGMGPGGGMGPDGCW